MAPSTTTAAPSPVPLHPSPKRARLSCDDSDTLTFPSSAETLGVAECLRLLSSSSSSSSASSDCSGSPVTQGILPATILSSGPTRNDLAASSDCSGSPATQGILPATLLSSGPTRNDLASFKSIFDAHGFRTSVVTSPRAALSIYKDSCNLDGIREMGAAYAAGKEFLVAMLGLHVHQQAIERLYRASARDAYCLLLFGERIRLTCPKAFESEKVRTLLEKYKAECRAVGDMAELTCITNSGKEIARSEDSPKAVASPSALAELHRVSSCASERLSSLISATVAADPRICPDQLNREYDRIASQNSTYANANAQIFLDAHNCTIKDVYFKRSHVAKFERISIYLYDPQVDSLKPPRFTFLPGLRRAIDDGPEALANDMVESFWANLLRHGYFATQAIREAVTPEVRMFFLSGISADPTLPLLLNAHFSPTRPLSFYLHGKAGAGKSSLVRNFSPSLNGAIEEVADPQVLVRFVKQNLNKPMRDLGLELDLRPNNNDLSVMSIIQGRRMTLAQTKPGLVVVGLEEIASDASDADPNQLRTCQLISQRFSGRNGEYREGNGGNKDIPRNSAKRGISGDASLLVLFTSNYELGGTGREALQRLEMFRNLKSVEMTAVSGADRFDFARAYTRQCIQDYFVDRDPHCELELNIPVGSGDTRPLVRHLRMISFFVCTLASDTRATVESSINASIIHDYEKYLTTVISGGKSIQLKLGSFDNLYPSEPRVYDSRSANIVSKLANNKTAAAVPAELTQIMDFYFHRTLAPTIVISNNGDLIRDVVAAVSAQKDVHNLSRVDPLNYKMMKSLYDDPNDTPNLRDDILKFGRGAYVAVEMICSSKDSQLRIREMIEDTPSMTAFSTIRSALYKEGIFFGIHVMGEITEELISRASLVL